MGPLVLRCPFSAVDEHPYSRPQLHLLQNPAMDCTLEFDKREGSIYEVMTHVNSAIKDLFV